MKKQLKLDKKRLLIFVAVVIVVIAVVVLIVKIVNNNEEKITIDGNASSIDGQNITDESSQVEYDGNPYNVPQDYTQTLNEFVGETGEALDENTLNEVKDNIINKFKGISTDKLGISVDMSNVKIVFNQGTTIIADSTCLVFAVYEQKDNNLNFISKYAMSIDTEVLYKYDSESLVFNMIEL
jgi:hypothetical protein